MSVVDQPIVILISGSGSNMAALVEASARDRWGERFGAGVVAVLSNRPDAAGLAWARERGLATAVVDHKQHADREAFDAALITAAGQPGSDSALTGVLNTAQDLVAQINTAGAAIQTAQTRFRSTKSLERFPAVTASWLMT